MKSYQFRDYFKKSGDPKNYHVAECQQCGKEIHWKDRDMRTGKYADYKPDMRFWWGPYSKAAYQADAEYEILCKDCHERMVRQYGEMISRDEMLEMLYRMNR